MDKELIQLLTELLKYAKDPTLVRVIENKLLSALGGEVLTRSNS